MSSVKGTLPVATETYTRVNDPNTHYDEYYYKSIDDDSYVSVGKIESIARFGKNFSYTFETGLVLKNTVIYKKIHLAENQKNDEKCENQKKEEKLTERNFEYN